MIGSHGGKRPGAGRPTGAKPDSRPHVLSQRYSSAELTTLLHHAEAAGYGSDLNAYIRSVLVTP